MTELPPPPHQSPCGRAEGAHRGTFVVLQDFIRTGKLGNNGFGFQAKGEAGLAVTMVSAALFPAAAAHLLEPHEW